MYSVDKHMQGLYNTLVNTNHEGTKLIANHIDDLYRTQPEDMSTQEVLTVLLDELTELQHTVIYLKEALVRKAGQLCTSK